MPELPEVETTRRGIEPHVVGRSIQRLVVHESRLRWPVPSTLAADLAGQCVTAVHRRGKYLLLKTGAGTLLVHLGMTGGLRYLRNAVPPPALHDHVDIHFEGGDCLRYHDPRRFGSLHFTATPETHPLLANIGPEPLGESFTPTYLAGSARGKRIAIKCHLMNSRVVAGVGNIYANEALFRAGIHPARAAGRIAAPRFVPLVASIRDVLTEAIAKGGTTLRDFLDSDGRPGYFRIDLDVYDRAGEACRRCGAAVRLRVLGQRSTYYCPRCQR